MPLGFPAKTWLTIARSSAAAINTTHRPSHAINAFNAIRPHASRWPGGAGSSDRVERASVTGSLARVLRRKVDYSGGG